MLSISVLAERLRSLNAASGGVYSTGDLGVLLDRSHPSRLTEAIRGLVRGGVLLRVRRGLYLDRLNGYRPEIAGQRWLSPAYLSTEAALDHHRLCETGITVYTYVTTRLIARHKDASKTLDGHRFVYRHVAAHLFFGYQSEDGILLAHPEKAVLDFLYFIYKKQQSVLSPQDIDFAQLKSERYWRYLRAYRQAGFKGFALSWLGDRGA
jgi:hypothetical protein